MTDEILERIATALERIADVLEFAKEQHQLDLFEAANEDN
jgi:hypothetical protein